MKGSSNIFRKNRPTTPSNYIGLATRSKRIPRRKKDPHLSLNHKKLNPSTEPIKFGPADTAPPATGFLYMLAVVGLVPLFLFVILMLRS